MKTNTRNALAASLLAVLLAAPAAADETAAADEPTAEATRVLMEVRQGAASEAGTPLTLTALLPLTFTVKKLHWSEKSEVFLETVQLARQLAAGESHDFLFLPDGDIPNLALCATPEIGPERCWKPALSGEDGSLIMDAPGFTLEGAPVAMTDPASLLGEWHDAYSGRCHMTITLGAGGRLLFEVLWGDGAGSDYLWRFSGLWEAGDALAYTDGEQLHRTSESDPAIVREESLYRDGTGSVFLKDGALYWNDLKENVCKDCVFRRAR